MDYTKIYHSWQGLPKKGKNDLEKSSDFVKKNSKISIIFVNLLRFLLRIDVIVYAKMRFLH